MAISHILRHSNRKPDPRPNRKQGEAFEKQKKDKALPQRNVKSSVILVEDFLPVAVNSICSALVRRFSGGESPKPSGQGGIHKIENNSRHLESTSPPPFRKQWSFYFVFMYTFSHFALVSYTLYVQCQLSCLCTDQELTCNAQNVFKILPLAHKSKIILHGNMYIV